MVTQQKRALRRLRLERASLSENLATLAEHVGVENVQCFRQLCL